MMMNNERVLPTSEYQVDEIVERAFTNIQNKAFSVTSAPTQPLNTSFMESSRNFWLEYEGESIFRNIAKECLVVHTILEAQILRLFLKHC